MQNFFNRELALVAVVCVALTACADTRPIRYAQLDASSQLQPNPGDKSGRIPYSYSSGVDWRKYSRIVVDPVAIYRGQDSQFQEVSETDKQELADYMGMRFAETLQTKFNVVNRADARTLRLRLTLTGAKPTKQFVGTVTKFDLAGGPYNVVQSIRGREGALSGSVSYAVEIFDSSTLELLGAYVAKQYPNAMNVTATFGALSAAKVGIEKGADDLLARLE